MGFGVSNFKFYNEKFHKKKVIKNKNKNKNKKKGIKFCTTPITTESFKQSYEQMK